MACRRPAVKASTFGITVLGISQRQGGGLEDNSRQAGSWHASFGVEGSDGSPQHFLTFRLMALLC